MSIFGDLDLTQASDDPFKIDDGTYEAVITKAEAGPTKSGDKNGFTIEYTIMGGPMDDRKVTEWKEIPKAADMDTAEGKRAASFLKRRLIDLGIPEDRMNTMVPDDIMGLDVTITVKHNEKSGFTNVNRVALRTGVTTWGATGGATASPVGSTVPAPADNPFLA